MEFGYIPTALMILNFFQRKVSKMSRKNTELNKELSMDEKERALLRKLEEANDKFHKARDERYLATIKLDKLEKKAREEHDPYNPIHDKVYAAKEEYILAMDMELFYGGNHIAAQRKMYKYWKKNLKKIKKQS